MVRLLGQPEFMIAVGRKMHKGRIQSCVGDFPFLQTLQRCHVITTGTVHRATKLSVSLDVLKSRSERTNKFSGLEVKGVRLEFGIQDAVSLARWSRPQDRT